MTPQLRNPFPGLRPFEADETHLFFGRDGQCSDIVTRLEKRRFVGVVGTSGSGKSSLVRAGLLPMLEGGYMASAGSFWRFAVMRPGADPIRSLARSLADPGVLADECELVSVSAGGPCLLCTEAAPLGESDGAFRLEVDLPLIFHPAVTRALSSFTPVSVG